MGSRADPRSSFQGEEASLSPLSLDQASGTLSETAMARRATVKTQDRKGTAVSPRRSPRTPLSRTRRRLTKDMNGFELFLSLKGKGECTERDISSDKYRYLYGTPEELAPKKSR